MIGPVLLFVGAVLLINGIWIFGAPAPQPGSVAARSGVLTLDSREVGIFNLFVGSLGFLVALAILWRAVAAGEIVGSSDIESGSFFLLFAFTYLWVAANQFIPTNGRALGWYCLFVAITAVPTAAITLATARGRVWPMWLGLDWAAWGSLWFLFFVLLALKKPIGRLTGVLSILEAVATCWVPAYLLLTDNLSSG